MNTTEIITIIGWPVSAYIGYLFGLRSQRIAREFAARDAAASRRREFLDVAADIKIRMSDPADIKAEWCGRITDDLTTLRKAYDRISHELPGVERVNTRAAMSEILKFSSMMPGDIYANGQELLDALNRLPSA